MAATPYADADTSRVFDRCAVRRHRARAAAAFARHDFLFREVADRIADRLADMRRHFPVTLDLGARGGVLGATLGARGGVERLVECVMTAEEAAATPTQLRIVGDEEFLPFASGSVDAVLSCLSLHWVNDLPGALIQARRALRPDGLFLAAMLGGETLHELRAVLLAAEAEQEGGVSPRVSPFAELADAASLMQRAGFALPVVDSDSITVTYPDALSLMRDLRGMGETNAAHGRRAGFTRRATLLAACARYADTHADAEGRLPATFQVLYLTGWAPHSDQPKALRPGSAETRLADALGTIERPAGDKAGPGGA